MSKPNLKLLFIEKAMNSKEAVFIFLKNSIKIEGFIQKCGSRTVVIKGHDNKFTLIYLKKIASVKFEQRSARRLMGNANPQIVSLAKYQLKNSSHHITPNFNHKGYWGRYQKHFFSRFLLSRQGCKAFTNSITQK